MIKTIGLIFILLFVSCTHNRHKTYLKKSNKLADQFTKEFSATSPELGSNFGYREFDKRGSNPSKEKEDTEIALLKKWHKDLEVKIPTIKNRNLKVDHLVLLQKVKLFLHEYEVTNRIAYLDIPGASKSVYWGLIPLINPQSPKERKQDAVDRFKYYMSEKGKLNYIQAFKSEIKRYQKKYNGKKILYPYRGEIEKYLKDSPHMVKGIKQLLSQTSRDDWQQEYELFKKEVQNYDSYLTKYILPKARTSAMLPKELYNLKLKAVGIDTTSDKLITDGKKAFNKTYQQYQKLAAKIAKKHGLKKNSPYAVINHLKKKQLTKLDEVMAVYQQSSARLESIIKKHQLITLPEKKLKIRFAGDVESKASPVPHLNPPPLVNNNGIVPEFVVPTSSSGKLPYDDFSYESAAMALTAHEGRPGHDLQFSKMLENQTSLIRASYAMNSVNVEGWGLYAEDLVYPYLSDEEKLCSLQLRLLRIARYYLDPQVQSGMASRKKVINTYHRKLGISKELATTEYDRYAFRSPGQAPAYYYGLLNIQNFKENLTNEYGKMNEKCFNDTLISFGLLPHKFISEFKEDFKKCRI